MVTRATGEGTYSRDYDLLGNDGTMLSLMSVTVAGTNGVPGSITSWKIEFKTGGTKVLEINNNNFASLLLRCDLQQYRVEPLGQFMFNSTDFYPGRMFSTNPDNMDVYVTIADDNGYTKTVSANFPFPFREV